MPQDEIRIPIPSLFGGISQQPAPLRFPHQVEDAQNAVFSVIDGLSKRPGSMLLKKITGLTTEGDYRLHSILRDHDEQYLVIYGEGELRVFEIVDDLNLLEATVNVSSNAQTYLDANTPAAADLRLISLRDYTLIVNTTVTTEATDAAGYTTSKDIVRYQNGRTAYQQMLAYTPADNAYVSLDEQDTAEDVQYWQYDAADGTFATAKFAGLTGNWGYPGGYYNDSSYGGGGGTSAGFKIGFVRTALAITGATFTTATKKLSKAGAFTAYTFTAGDQIYVASGTGVTAGWYTIVGRDSADQIELSADIGGTNPSDVATTGVGKEYAVETNFNWGDNDGSHPGMADVAKEYQDALQAAGAKDALVTWVNTGGSKGYFIITSPYRGTGCTITAPTTNASFYDITASGRPFYNPTITAGTGTPTDDTLAPAKRWTRVSAPNDADAVFTPTTMPIKMVRTSYAGDGSTAAVFSVDVATWTPRTSGDETTNPVPSFITRKISDIQLHRNRLVFAADDNVVFSQAGDLFNFFIDQFDNIVDSDPIDVSISSDEVTLVDYILGFNKTLLIFTKAGKQFELNAPEALTPSTAAITASTSYQTAPVRPITLGDLAFFVAARKDAGVLFEYFYDQNRANNTAADDTAHVPALLPANIRSLVGSTNNNFIALLPPDCTKLYTYQFYYSAQKKEQSAWGKWVFDENYRLVDIACLRDDLYMLVEMDGQFMFERIPISRQVLQ